MSLTDVDIEAINDRALAEPLTEYTNRGKDDFLSHAREDVIALIEHIYRLDEKIARLGDEIARLKAPVTPRLSGVALQSHLIAEGHILCKACRGTGGVYDVEDEETMACPRCSGSGSAMAVVGGELP